MSFPTSSRRGFLKTAVATGVSFSPLSLPDETAHVFLAGPYLQPPASNAMTVRWITAKPTYSWVEFGPTEALGQKAQSVKAGIVDANNRVHAITLTGLEPGKKYFYRIFSKEVVEFKPYKVTYGETIQSDILSFIVREAAGKQVSALIFNDLHDRPESIGHLCGLAGVNDRDFVFLNGDIFDHQNNEQQLIDHLLAPATKTFASRTPFLYVRGNHETRGAFRSDWADYFTFPDQRLYFDFTWGPVHFLVLDTGEDKPDAEPVYAGLVDFDAYRQEQARWAEQVMQSKAFKKAAFRVVLMHIPPQYSGDWHGATHCKQLFSPLFDKYKVDLCVSGHTHKYGVHPPVAGQHHYPVVIGGGPKDGNRTVIRLTADTRNLQLSMLRDDGSEVGKYAISSRS